ncbi:MAG: ABC transporter permease, partial [Pseudomonadota bacterium]
MHPIPRWADVILIPLISVLLAAICAGLLLVAINEDPFDAMKLMIDGTLFRSEGIGFMLYYTTNFVFTGLAVSIAFHAALFNIGGEGQAQLGGLGVALAMLFIPWPHWTLAIIGASLGAMAFGAVWAAIPAYLQAKRGSHIVITTIMFNFIAAAFLNYLLVNILKPVGSMDPATPSFPQATHLPTFRDMAEALGFDRMFGASPANVTTFLAVIAAVAVWVLIWRTRLGYEIRSFGKSPTAA